MKPSQGPEAELEIGRVVPLALVRVAVAPVVAAVLIISALSQWPGTGPVWGIAPVAGLVAMWRPWGAVPALAGAAAGVILLVGGKTAPVLVVMALVLLIHLALVLAAFAARASWVASVEVEVLSRAARPFLVVQGGAQVLTVLALLVSGVSLGEADWWRTVALLGAIGIAVVALPSRPDAE